MMSNTEHKTRVIQTHPFEFEKLFLIVLPLRIRFQLFKLKLLIE